MATYAPGMTGNESMYKPAPLLPPTPSYDIGNGNRTTDVNAYNNYVKTGSINGNIPTQPPSTQAQPLTWDQVGQQGSKMPAPTDATKPPETGKALPPPPGGIASPQPSLGGRMATSSEAESMVNKYADLQKMGPPPNVNLNQNPRSYIETAGNAIGSQANSGQAYQPTPAFIQYGDPIMQTFVNAALSYQNDVTNTGYTAKRMQTEMANQVQGLDLQAANLQNVMNGTRDDIRAEISKAGGFATESQIEGLVTTRNRDLLKQYNNLELQKQTMQNQMQLQVGLANADHQYAMDKFDNLTKTSTLYKGLYDNATNQIDKLIQNVGYSGLAAAYNNDPGTLAMVERHLSMPQGTLSDPQKLASLETYRQKTLNLSNARFGALYGYSPTGTTPPNGGTPAASVLPGGGDHVTANSNVPYEKYGLLTNTDFNPSNGTDQTALNYLNVYLNNGTVPNASAVGLRGSGNIVSQKFQAATTRANDLFYAATGQNLPPPSVVKSNIGLISANNKLANQLKVQENTVNANFGLSLQNLNENNLNTAWPILNGVINNIKNAEGDPAVAQYLAQNSTIQQELGNLLAVKNASGTTVYDKIAGAGLLPKNATPAQQIQVVKTLLAEAKNASNAFKQVNGELYSSVDPLERLTDNPNRQNFINAQVPSDWITMTGPKGTFKVDPKNVDIMKKNGYK